MFGRNCLPDVKIIDWYVLIKNLGVNSLSNCFIDVTQFEHGATDIHTFTLDFEYFC